MKRLRMVVELPDEIAEQVEELQLNEPEYIGRLISVNVARRARVLELRRDAEEREREVLAENDPGRVAGALVRDTATGERIRVAETECGAVSPTGATCYRRPGHEDAHEGFATPTDVERWPRRRSAAPW